MQETSRQRPSTHAVVFHSVASSLLDSQGFALSGDPWLLGRYGGSSALYRSRRGLALWVMFEPHDGAAAGLTCGREWTPQQGAPFLSNVYAKLAQRFGLDVPVNYPIAEGEQPMVVVKKIVADLERSLPTVVSKISLHDLIVVENEGPVGAAMLTMGSARENYKVSDFS